jgi:hypothetical protein
MGSCVQHNWSHPERNCPVCRVVELRHIVEFMRDAGLVRLRQGDVELEMACARSAVEPQRPAATPVIAAVPETPHQFAERMRSQYAAVASSPVAAMVEEQLGIALSGDDDALAPEDAAEVDAFEKWQRTGKIPA